MPPIRFRMRCSQRAGDRSGAASGGPEQVGQGLVVEIRQLQGTGDLAAAIELVAQSRAGDPALAGRWSPTGLRAELTSREGRRVHGWLAWPVDPYPPVAPLPSGTRTGEPVGFACDAGPGGRHCPLGMVAVVDVGRQPLVRASIAWLLVHPAVRRRGVGTALVRRARAEVGSLGGDVISAETLSSWPAATAFWTRVAGDVEFEPLRAGGVSMTGG